MCVRVCAFIRMQVQRNASTCPVLWWIASSSKARMLHVECCVLMLHVASIACAPMDGIEFQNAYAPDSIAAAAKRPADRGETCTAAQPLGLPAIPSAYQWRVAALSTVSSARRVLSPWSTLQLLRRRRGCARHSERRGSASPARQNGRRGALYRVKSDGSGTGALSEDEDARRVATERRGVLRDPAHRFALVLDAEVARRAVGRVCRDVGAAEEAKDAEAIIKRDHDCNRRGRQRVAVVDGPGSADVAAWRRPYAQSWLAPCWAVSERAVQTSMNKK